MPLDYLSYFTLVLGGIYRMFVIYQADYSIHSNLESFPYFEVQHSS